ncbi:MAG: rod shape-determining protein RodA [Elusimicrobia bacterium]|nr:rod shape-determining protein RodA [Elusimicrobiota bacterium]
MLTRAESGAKGRVDWALVFAASSLALIGTLAVFSAASPLASYASILRTHFMALALGALLFLLGMNFNYQIFQDQAKAVYFVALALLAIVLVAGSAHRGHRAWLHMGFFTFQPAELARVVMILVLAAFLDARARKMRDLSTILYTMALAAPVMVLILKQPDFSTALTFLPIMLGMLFCGGADIAHLLAFVGYGLTTIAMPLVYTFVRFHSAELKTEAAARFVMRTSHFGAATASVLLAAAALCLIAWRLSVLLRLRLRAAYFAAIPVVLSAGVLSGIFVNGQMKGYQRDRFVAYVAPQADIQGAAYHVHQSQIAIGSGGPWGKGLFNGTQSQLGFLPERHTDFIFSVVGEEMGFLGTMAILCLYLLLIWRIVAIAKLARDRYGFLVCVGLATMFAFELTLNVGMCLGLMPVAGIPLPLISYGGSSLVITLWSLGIVANVYSRRYALL